LHKIQNIDSDTYQHHENFGAENFKQIEQELIELRNFLSNIFC